MTRLTEPFHHVQNAIDSLLEEPRFNNDHLLLRTIHDYLTEFLRAYTEYKEKVETPAFSKIRDDLDSFIEDYEYVRDSYNKILKLRNDK